MAISVHTLFYVWNFTCKVISMFAKLALMAEAMPFAPHLPEF